MSAGRFRHIHVDSMGPLALQDGYRYVMTAVYRFTRWPKEWPIRGITAKEMAGYIVSDYLHVLLLIKEGNSYLV